MIKQIVINANSNSIPQIKDKTVDLVITSPPYPMIEMWDDMFSEQNPQIKYELQNENGEKAFELMHQILDKTWNECDRTLKDKRSYGIVYCFIVYTPFCLISNYIINVVFLQ